jgi:hypothetical protein
MNVETAERNLTTADLVAAADAPNSRSDVSPEPSQPGIEKKDSSARSDGAQLAPLFLPDAAQSFRARWDAVQIGFVDDPKQAVRQADELVAQVMKSLAETFSNERAKLEGQVEQTEQTSTENLRVALQRYRSFFQRLLSL